MKDQNKQKQKISNARQEGKKVIIHAPSPPCSKLGERDFYTITIPEEIPEFTERELDYLNKCRFRTKMFPKVSLKTKYKIRLFLAILRANKADYTQINCTELGRLFKSQQMASNIIKFLLENKIIERNNNYNADLGISRKYRISLNFRMVTNLPNLKKENRKENSIKEILDQMNLTEDEYKAVMDELKQRIEESLGEHLRIESNLL